VSTVCESLPFPWLPRRFTVLYFETGGRRQGEFRILKGIRPEDFIRTLGFELGSVYKILSTIHRILLAIQGSGFRLDTGD